MFSESNVEFLNSTKIHPLPFDKCLNILGIYPILNYRSAVAPLKCKEFSLTQYYVFICSDPDPVESAFICVRGSASTFRSGSGDIK